MNEACFEEADMRKAAANRSPGYEAAVYAVSRRQGTKLCMLARDYFRIKAEFRSRIITSPNSNRIVLASRLPEPTGKLTKCCGGAPPPTL